MKDIKIDWRSILAFDRTNDLMNILCSPDIKHYYKAIQLWLSSGLILRSHWQFLPCQRGMARHGAKNFANMIACVPYRASPHGCINHAARYGTVRHGTAPHNSKNGCLTSTRVSQAPPTNYSAPRVIKLLDASFWFSAPTALPLVTENIRHYLERSKAETLKLVAFWGEERIQKKLQEYQSV